MTYKEAAKLIEAKMEIHKMIYEKEVDEPLRTAYNMAIEALYDRDAREDDRK